MKCDLYLISCHVGFEELLLLTALRDAKYYDMRKKATAAETKTSAATVSSKNISNTNVAATKKASVPVDNRAPSSNNASDQTGAN